MPEGDSVYRLAERLRSSVGGARIVSGELRSGDAAGMSLEGWAIREFDTHGKHLLTRFDSGWTLHTHLRMQGSWSVTGAGKALPPAQRDTARVRLRLDDGRTLWGVDLPVVELVRTEAERSVVGYLGPDPLRSDWDADAAVQRLMTAGGRPSVAALLDQRLMAGLGNMWANEVCFLRGVWPWTPVADVDVAGLVATAARGLRASVTVPGMFQTTTGVRRRGERHFVVGRAGRPCLRCGTTVAVRAEVMNDPEQRRTWWCPHCQPEPATPVT